MKDKLDIMFETQYNLQDKLNIWNQTKTLEGRQQYVNQMILACQEEIVEIMRETAYKNKDLLPFGWKKQQQWNVDNYKDEIIDLFHFLMNLSLVVGMDSSEFFERYKQKNEINIKRQKEGY